MENKNKNSRQHFGYQIMRQCNWPLKSFGRNGVANWTREKKGFRERKYHPQSSNHQSQGFKKSVVRPPKIPPKVAAGSPEKAI